VSEQGLNGTVPTNRAFAWRIVSAQAQGAASEQMQRIE